MAARKEINRMFNSYGGRINTPTVFMNPWYHEELWGKVNGKPKEVMPKPKPRPRRRPIVF